MTGHSDRKIPTYAAAYADEVNMLMATKTIRARQLRYDCLRKDKDGPLWSNGNVNSALCCLLSVCLRNSAALRIRSWRKNRPKAFEHDQNNIMTSSHLTQDDKLCSPPWLDCQPSNPGHHPDIAQRIARLGNPSLAYVCACKHVRSLEICTPNVLIDTCRYPPHPGAGHQPS